MNDPFQRVTGDRATRQLEHDINRHLQGITEPIEVCLELAAPYCNRVLEEWDGGRARKLGNETNGTVLGMAVAGAVRSFTMMCMLDEGPDARSFVVVVMLMMGGWPLQSAEALEQRSRNIDEFDRYWPDATECAEIRRAFVYGRDLGISEWERWLNEMNKMDAR